MDVTALTKTLDHIHCIALLIHDLPLAKLVAAVSSLLRLAKMVTVTSTNVQRQDKYYLLKYDSTWQVLHVDEETGYEYKLRPVTLHECSFELWQNAPDRTEQYKKWKLFQLINEQVLGRRINDEVELFELDGDGGEPPGLRQELEKEGE